MTPTRKQLQEWFTPERTRKFWSKFKPTKSGCLEWTGATVKGYGAFYPMIAGKERMVQTHRAIFVLEHGNITPVHKVRHFICDNPLCGNIKHLRIGLTADNNRDKTGMKYQGKGGDKCGPNYRSHVRYLKPKWLTEWREEDKVTGWNDLKEFWRRGIRSGAEYEATRQKLLRHSMGVLAEANARMARNTAVWEAYQRSLEIAI